MQVIPIRAFTKVFGIEKDAIESWLSILDYEVDSGSVDIATIEPITFMAFLTRYVSDIHALKIVKKILKEDKPHPVFSVVNQTMLVIGQDDLIFDMDTANEVEFEGPVFTSNAVNVESFATLIVKASEEHTKEPS